VPETVGALVDRAATGLAALADLGASVDDEWQYLADLEAVWTGRLKAVGAARSRESVDARVSEAVDRALDEIRRITDPHRAIDWMSTLPQVVLLSLGEEDSPPPAASR
jgi:hypothetical protein